MKSKSLCKTIIVAGVLSLCFFYVIGCGSSSGGTTSNPVGAGSGALMLSGRVVASDTIQNLFSLNLRGDILGAPGNSSNLLPVPNADVWLEKNSLIFDKTNASGVYQLVGVPEGENRIVVKAQDSSRSNTYKMLVNVTKDSELTDNEQPDIQLKEAKNYVTGILRDSDGKPLPAGTNLTLWGEPFTVEDNGRFTSPPLPEGFSEAEIIVVSNAFSNEVIIKAPFISDTAPPEIEIFLPAKDKAGNSAPIAFLTARKGGVPASKISPNEQITLTAEAVDPDPQDANNLTIQWSSDKGTLATNSAQPFQASWIAPDHPGMATIEIRIYDSQGAYGAVNLKILVGLDSPPVGPADTLPPTIAEIYPASGALNIAVDTSTVVTLNESIATLTVNANTFVLASGDSIIPGSVTLNPDGKSAVFKPTENMPTDSVITVKLSGIKDLAGNLLVADLFTFTTAMAPDTTAPTNQDTVLAASNSVKGSAAVTIVSSGDAANSIWLAPAGTTSFVESATMTKAGGTATSINAPATEGTYKLFIIDSSGNLSAASTASVTVDNTAPTNQNTVLAASASVKSGVAVTIVSSGDAANSIWLAPAGTTSFVESATMTKAGGTATSINAPANEGTYKLFIIDASGNISAASTASVTVDNTAPASQNTVLAASASAKGSAALTIVSSGDAANSVWLAPAGTTSFVESATMTKAGGTATSINAPATEGTYKLFIIDASGNLSAASTADVTVDNTAPTNQNTVLAASTIVKGSVAVTIVSSGDAANSVWLAPAGTTSFVESATITKAGGTATSINAPATEGTYKLFAIDAAGNISSASTADVNVDNTAPTNQNIVLAASASVKGGVAVTIVSSGDAANSVWLAPAGTTSFVESATITKAGGTATSINAPATEGTYKLFVIDAAGNISAASTADVTVDNTVPTIVSVIPAENAVHVATNTLITVTFSEAMTTSTITDLAFTVASGAVSISGDITFSADQKVATFSPLAPLPHTSLITVNVTTAVKDIAGNALNTNVSWNFTTAPIWAQVACGTQYTLAIKTDGTLWAWGSNLSGQLGDGTTTQKTSPVQIAGTTWKQVACANSHSVAIKTDGTLWAWGRNVSGEIGDGTTTQRNSPVQIAGTTWKQVTCGDFHTLAIKTDGTLWAWGNNDHGQLGDGTTTQRTSPVQIAGTTWKQVAGGGYSTTLAVKTDGTLWAWGWNNSGELGDGTTTQRTSPVQIAGTTWQQVACGGSRTLAIKSDGTLWAWGGNSQGQLGDGTTTQRTSPVQIAGTTWQHVACGRYDTFAVKTDGTLWAWGWNLYGEVGDGTTTQRNSPVQIAGTTWKQTAAGANHTLAVKTDGTLWGWGNNQYGNLGDGTTTTKTSPVQLGQ